MRHWGALALLALFVFGESPAVRAASFDCQRATTTVEKRICEDGELSDLDGRMSEAYARARARAGKDLDALRRDQSLWLASRNAVVLSGYGSSIYNERIAFLDRAFRKSAKASPLLEAMAAYLKLNPDPPRRGSSWTAFGLDKVFTMPDMVPMEESKGAPFDMHAVDILTEEEGSDERRFIQWFAHENVGAVVSYGGTMHNESWRLFCWGKGGVRSLKLPYLFDNPVTLGGYVADYRGTITALERDEESTASTRILGQALVGKTWEEMSGMTFRFDMTLLPPKAYCSEPGCAELVASARNTMIRFDRERDGDALSKGLTDDQKAMFSRLVERANAPTSRTSMVPDFDGKSRIPLSHHNAFNDPAVYFPVMWKGEMLLGRVGQETFSQGESDNLILAVWRPSEGGLTPVLALSGEKQRTRFLFSVNDDLPRASPDSP